MKKEAKEIAGALKALGNSDIAEHSRRYFKTGKGEYGEGDRFLGVRVPAVRSEVMRVIREGRKADRPFRLETAVELLQSPWHEVRLFALLAMVELYRRGSAREKAAVYKAYLANTDRIDNWDLVDLSAHHIVGAHLEDRSRKQLHRLSRSRSLWRRRIAVIATFHFIRNNEFEDALAIAQTLLDDDHDLIHKAVGWMLREIGKRDGVTERFFLKKHYNEMPRTMLRYAIEKFPEWERKAWLRGEVE